MKPDDNPPLVTFEAKFELDPPGTPPAPRPSVRVWGGNPETMMGDGVLVTFDSVSEPLPPGTPASPRPPGRPREGPAPTDPRDEAFARELADRVLEYARQRPAGLSAEELAALIQQLLSRRSA